MSNLEKRKFFPLSHFGFSTQIKHLPIPLLFMILVSLYIMTKIYHLLMIILVYSFFLWPETLRKIYPSGLEWYILCRYEILCSYTFRINVALLLPWAQQNIYLMFEKEKFSFLLLN